MLSHYKGTLIMVSHDVELLTTCANQFWHIDEGCVTFFSGTYDSYLKEKASLLNHRMTHLASLKKEQKKTRQALEKERQRAAQSKRANRNENDLNLLRVLQETGSRTSGKKSGKIYQLQDQVDEALQALKTPEVIIPTFNVPAEKPTPKKRLVEVRNGSCGYDKPLLNDITLYVNAYDHVALVGDNGSGKSTLLKALLHDATVIRQGEWLTPAAETMGYVDQYYNVLDDTLLVFETIERRVINWTVNDIRNHLNSFLFRKNEETTALVSTLSGGEKMRLTLAFIAAKTPTLLLLDEITNNLDRETKEHVIEVLRCYPGTFIVISHDQDFLGHLALTKLYAVRNHTVVETMIEKEMYE